MKCATRSACFTDSCPGCTRQSTSTSPLPTTRPPKLKTAQSGPRARSGSWSSTATSQSTSKTSTFPSSCCCARCGAPARTSTISPSLNPAARTRRGTHRCSCAACSTQGCRRAARCSKPSMSHSCSLPPLPHPHPHPHP
eukprot:06910_1